MHSPGALLVIASMYNPLVKVAVDIDKGVSTEDSLQVFLADDVWSGRLTEPSASLSYYRTDDKSKAAIAFCFEGRSALHLYIFLVSDFSHSSSRILSLCLFLIRHCFFVVPTSSSEWFIILLRRKYLLVVRQSAMLPALRWVLYKY